jgi:hypothetical protein
VSNSTAAGGGGGGGRRNQRSLQYKEQNLLPVREGVVDCKGLANHGNSQQSLLVPDEGVLKFAETRQTRI